MIKKVYNYLYVRGFLLAHNSSQLINMGVDENTYKFLVDGISSIMQEENYLLVADELVQRASNLVHHYRFNYNKNKEINDQVNFIIERLRKYRNMSTNHRIELSKEWFEEERKKREIPRRYATPSNLFTMIYLDAFSFSQMISTEEFAIVNTMEYLSLINLFFNQFPSIFENPVFLERIKHNCEFLKTLPNVPRIYRKMVNRILDRFSKEYIEDRDIDAKVKCYLKKKDNN